MSWLAWSICRIEFFFTTPNSTSSPSAEKMFSDCLKMMIDRSANGSVSGSDSRIVTGCSHDSNCAARIRYMKISDSDEGEDEVLRRAAELARPAREAAAIFRPGVQVLELGFHRVLHFGLRRLRAAGSRTP